MWTMVNHGEDPIQCRGGPGVTTATLTGTVIRPDP